MSKFNLSKLKVMLTPSAFLSRGCLTVLISLLSLSKHTHTRTQTHIHTHTHTHTHTLFLPLFKHTHTLFLPLLLLFFSGLTFKEVCSFLSSFKVSAKVEWYAVVVLSYFANRISRPVLSLSLPLSASLKSTVPS